MSDTVQTELPKFQKPVLQFNETGFGPNFTNISETFKDMPYQPFSKSDRLGKICDWTGTINQDKKFQSKLKKNLIYQF